jgi:zinc transport system ATP-binding protein
MNSETVVEIRNVSFRYESLPVLEDVSLEVRAGDFLGVVGPNGGGKTTLIRLMLGLLKPAEGTVTLFSGEPAQGRQYAGYVPQFSLTDHTFPITVAEVVAMGVMTGHTFYPKLSGAVKAAAREAMAAVDIEPLAGTPWGSLSGGQRQRALIARALAGKPHILVLDEPTASVDATIEQGFFDLLKRLNESMTIVLVSHDIGFISSYVNRIACVNRRVAVHDMADMHPDQVIRDAYGTGMTMLTHHCGL